MELFFRLTAIAWQALMRVVRILEPLFSLLKHMRGIREAKICIGEKAYWLLPNALVDVPYKPIKELDFTSCKSQKKKLDQKID